LNAFPFGLYLPIIVSRSLSGLNEHVTFRGDVPFQVAFVEAFRHVPAQMLVSVVAITVLMVSAVAALNLTQGRPAPSRIAILVGALLATALFNMPVIWQLNHALGETASSWTLWRSKNASNVVQWMLFGGLASAPIYLRRRREDAVRALRDAKRRTINADREETESRLQSLQAQIEPHFLFNTLAHILRLLEIDPQRGRAMLQSLTDYMRSALPQLRDRDFTLAHELALTRAYVNVQQIRMGERLRVEFDVPAAVMTASVPPMTVLTLAENAVKHGLGPKREGGTLRIEASLRGEMLEVAVCDDGVGLQIGAGSGHGLANTRLRLGTAYGSRAALEIGSRPGGGVRAAIVLPFAAVAGAGSAQ
jgi:signal transduction histidine kinase